MRDFTVHVEPSMRKSANRASEFNLYTKLARQASNDVNVSLSVNDHCLGALWFTCCCCCAMIIADAWPEVDWDYLGEFTLLFGIQGGTMSIDYLVIEALICGSQWWLLFDRPNFHHTND